MAYLGNTPTQQGFIPAIDFFSGNGSTVAFTLSRPVASVAQVQATIENVPQNPGTAFTVSGNTITFDGAPASGTNNIYVYYTSPITQVIQPGQGTVFPSSLSTPNALFWNTSGNVGIGTNSPTRRLELGPLGAMRMQTGSITMDCTPTPGGIDGFVWNMSSGYYNWSSGGSTRMLIDSSGRVTTPFQPAFFVIANGAYTVGNDIVYNEVSVNRGSHYNAGSGRFTAPVAGAYFFSIKNLQTNTSSVIRFYFVLNGTVLGVGSTLDGAWQSRFDNNNNFKEQQTSTILNLNAGDYVTVRQQAGTNSIDGSGYSTFLGNLLG
jgi:hypothetical protein